MASARRKTLKDNAILLLDQLHPDVDIPTLMIAIGLEANDRHYVMAESGIIRKMRFFDLLSHRVGVEENWDTLIAYLWVNDRTELADVLLGKSTGVTQQQATVPKQIIQHTLVDITQHVSPADKQSACWRSESSALAEFAHRLAQYYQKSYASLPTMGESPRHVKDVWVPLQIDGRGEAFLNADYMNHTQLLDRLKNSEDRHVALIKGDPGMGKTTLTKKIAYDWAVKYGSTTESPEFAVVLAVPLRQADKSMQFDQLAIDYFMTIGGGQLVKGLDKAELIREIDKLQGQLLVILDGLDEYKSYADSPFRNVFAPPFRHSAISTLPPPIVSFKLIITSRPYACERVSDDFWPLYFSILPLNASHLGDFCRLYCQTSQGVSKVTEYLKVNAKLVIQVPLILTFVCYLADSVEEIPTNMTSLYSSLARQMLKRENRQEKLNVPVDIRRWRESNVVVSTSDLAYRETTESHYLFDSESLENSHVTNDSFICGYLLHKLDLSEEELTAEFPHRSIQEYFAALHCYRMLLSSREKELREIFKLIDRDCQVGRFLFGTCSKEGRFDKLTNWLGPKLIYPGYDLCQPAATIDRFGTSLIDCSAEENRLVGDMMLQSVKDLEETIKMSWNRTMEMDVVLEFVNCPDEFKSALNLFALTTDSGGSVNDWWLAGNQNSARLVYVHDQLPELLTGGKLDRIEVLIWANQSTELHIALKSWLGKVKMIPPIRTFAMITADSLLDKSVTVRICYDQEHRLGLNNFRFEYKDINRTKLRAVVENENWKKLEVGLIEETKCPDTRRTFRQMLVTVNDPSISQATLIYSLMHLSLQ